MAKRNSSAKVALTATALSVLVSSQPVFAECWIGFGVSIGSHVARHAVRYAHYSHDDYQDSAAPARRAQSADNETDVETGAIAPSGTSTTATIVGTHGIEIPSQAATAPASIGTTHGVEIPSRPATTPAVSRTAAPTAIGTTHGTELPSHPAATPAVSPATTPAVIGTRHGTELPSRPAATPAASPATTPTIVNRPTASDEEDAPKHERRETASSRTTSLRSHYEAMNKAVDLFNSGVEKTNATEYTEAVELFKKALQIDPSMGEAHGALGMAYDRLKDFAKATPEIEEGLHQGLVAPDLWFCAGDCNLHTGNYEEAARCFKKYVSLGTNTKCVDSARRSLSILDHDYFHKADGDYLADATIDGVNHWPASAMPIKVFIDDSRKVSGFKPEFVGQLRQAFEDWSVGSQGKVSFAFTTDADEAQIKCAWTDDVTKFGDTQELGLTHVMFEQGSGVIQAATIDLYSLADRGGVSTEQLLRTAKAVQLHEVGHALGLGHSQSEYDIMYPFTSPEGLEFPLTARDINTLVALYDKASVKDIATTSGAHTTSRKHSILDKK